MFVYLYIVHTVHCVVLHCLFKTNSHALGCVQPLTVITVTYFGNMFSSSGSTVTLLLSQHI
jgi:hypothetical protein